MKSYDRLFIGGDWVEPSSTAVFDVISPTTEELVGRVPEAQVADVDRAVAAAREAFDHGPWPRMAPTERAVVLTKVADAIRNDMQGISELISNEMGSPISWGTLAQVLAPTMILDYYAGLGSTFAFDTVKDGLMGPVLVTQGAGRGGGRHHPLERPALLGLRQAGPGAAVGKHGCVQAGSGDAARCQRAGGDLRRGRAAQGRAERGAGRPGGGRAPGQPPRCRQGVLHRLDRRRSQDRRRLRGQPQAIQPRAGRQVGRHPPGRRRPRRLHPAACCPTPS